MTLAPEGRKLANVRWAVMASAFTPMGSLGRPGRCTSPAETKVVTPPLTHESIQPSWFCRGVQSPNTGWQWLSISPGATAQPLASMTRSGLSVSTSLPLPIAVMRPSTATIVSASRIGWPRSPDSSRPMLRTTSLPCIGPAAASTAILALPNVRRRSNDHGGVSGEAQVGLLAPKQAPNQKTSAICVCPMGGSR